MIATNDSAHAPPVFALTSAAAVHALALYRVRVPRVHTVYPDAPRHSEGGVVRHRGDLADSDIVEVGGILCTSVARTAYDLARLASAEVGLVCMNTALSRVGGDPRRYDEPAAEEWLEDMSERMDATGGARGIRQARMLRDIADGRSQQPLEITTKLQLRRLGCARRTPPGLRSFPARSSSAPVDTESAGSVRAINGALGAKRRTRRRRARARGGRWIWGRERGRVQWR